MWQISTKVKILFILTKMFTTIYFRNVKTKCRHQHHKLKRTKSETMYCNGADPYYRTEIGGIFLQTVRIPNVTIFWVGCFKESWISWQTRNVSFKIKQNFRPGSALYLNVPFGEQWWNASAKSETWGRD